MELVFILNDQPMTDSLTVAEAFLKRHADVLRDIKNLECSEEFRERNFAQTTYLSAQNKELPRYCMSEKGFNFLVMGYTGKDAAKYKEAYINEFERMQNELNRPRVLTEREQVIASMKLSLENSEELTQVRTEVKQIKGMVENQITLDYGEQRRIQRAVSQRVYEITNIKEERNRLFRELYRELKDRFATGSYKDIKRKDMLTAVNYIAAWIPKKVS